MAVNQDATANAAGGQNAAIDLGVAQPDGQRGRTKILVEEGRKRSRATALGSSTDPTLILSASVISRMD